MKNLFLGFFPILLFWIFEEKFGTLGGIVAALAWSVGELGFEWVRFRKIQRFTLFSGLLVVVFGGLDLWMENGRLFLFQPVIVQAVFIVLFAIGLRGDPPKILELMGNRAPALSTDPAHRWAQIQMMRRLMVRMCGVLIVHCGIMVYAALKMTTSAFVFLKGPGLLILLLFWSAGEFIKILLVRRRLKRDTVEIYGDPLGNQTAQNSNYNSSHNSNYDSKHNPSPRRDPDSQD